MSVIGSNILAGASGSAGAGDAQINRSLRFDSGSSSYLNKSFSSAGNRKTWSLSFWIKRCFNASFYQSFLINRDNASYNLRIDDPTTSKFYLNFANNAYLTTTPRFRDFSSWMHVVIVYDSRAATTSTDRLKIYVNGERITEFDYESYPTDDQLSEFNNSNNYGIGYFNANTALDAYLADYHFVDGQALEAADFGEPDSNGVWQPKAYSGSHGQNGFHLDFSDASSNASLGYDAAGSNNWTVNSLVADGGVLYSKHVSGYLNGLTDTATYPVTNLFDGSTSTIVLSSNTSGSGIKFVPTTDITGSIELYLRNGDTANSTFSYSLDNGSTFTNLTTTGGSGSYVSIGSQTISNANGIIVRHITTAGTNSVNWRAIRVDSTVLTDGTPSNTDSVIDTPTSYEAETGNNGGNYCTLVDLDGASNITLSNGHLEYAITSSTNEAVMASMAAASGKFYWEVTMEGSVGLYGVVDYSKPYTTRRLISSNCIYYEQSGYLYNYIENDISQQYTSFAAGDVIGIALDMDAGTVHFYKNNTLIVSSTSGVLSGRTMGPAFSGFFSTTSATVNFGQRPFVFPPGTGSGPSSDYKSLCTQNLTDPTVENGSDYFDVATWDGNGSTQSITSLSFQPDFLWYKSRDDNYHHGLQDSVRGVGKSLSTSRNDIAEQTETTGLDAFTSNGFDLDGDGFYFINVNNDSMVGWAWDAGANSSKTFTVKVVSDSGNKYRFDDFGTSAVTLDLEEGSTYVFDQSDSSNATHPLRFSTTSDGTHGGGSEYTTGVTTTGTPGSAGASTTIVVASGAPTLYYYCSGHSGMGGQANTNSTAGASNFDGSIQSTVRANASAGFSIVTWNGTAVSQVVGHGLGASPEMIVVKSRDQTSQPWVVYHSVLGKGGVLQLSSDAANITTYSEYWGTAEPSSTVFGTYTGSHPWANNYDDMVAYCFAPVEGYSAFGSYVGNNSSDGPFVYTGFRPKFVLIKNTTNSGNWNLFDASRSTYNATGHLLLPNSTNSEYTQNPYNDFLSNGFKVRTTDSGKTGLNANQSNDTYIYAAFAEHPFKTARAR